MNQDNHKLKNLMTYEKKSCKAKSIMLSVCLDSAEKHFSFQLRLTFSSGSRALFTGPTNIFFSKNNFKTRSHSTIYTFKNYFATVFSVFNNKRYPNIPSMHTLNAHFLGNSMKMINPKSWCSIL